VFLLELELPNAHSLLTVKTKLNYNRPQFGAPFEQASTGSLCSIEGFLQRN